MHRAEVEALIKAMHEEYNAKMQLLLEANSSSTKMTRKLRMDQEKSKFKTPADKRAVGFLMDESFDLEDCFNKIRPVLDEDGDLIQHMGDRKDDIIKDILQWVALRKKKVQREQEAYRMALHSRYSWLTEKYYRSVVPDVCSFR